MPADRSEFVQDLADRIAALLDDAGFAFVRNMAGVQYDSTDLAQPIAEGLAAYFGGSDR